MPEADGAVRVEHPRGPQAEEAIEVGRRAPGVGKTLSARHYADWDAVEPLLSSLRMSGTPIPPAVGDCHALVYTPDVAATPNRLASDLRGLAFGFNRLVEAARDSADDRPCWPDATAVDLLIVDEADRLKMVGLEQVRDVYDRANFGFGLGLVLIGLPGIEKRLARYPQLYSRVGFVHQYRPLGDEELRFVLTHKWAELGLSFCPDDYTDAEALGAIARVTGGNFRLVQRLFSQIERILRINALQTITQEVVEAAREHLVVGSLP